MIGAKTSGIGAVRDVAGLAIGIGRLGSPCAGFEMLRTPGGRMGGQVRTANVSSGS